MTIKSLRLDEVDGTTVLFVERVSRVLAFTKTVVLGKTYEEGETYQNVQTERVTCPRRQLLAIGEYQLQQQR